MHEVSIETKLKEGRGSGTGAGYKPWIRIGELNSKGTCALVTDWKHGRAIHCLSQAEVMAYCVLRWNYDNIDIREQYPLNNVATKSIAHELGIPHVVGSKGVYTTDFLVTKKDGTFEAYSVKSSRNLSKRELRTMAVEEKYWQERNVRFSVLYKDDININLYSNIRLMVPYYHEENVYDKITGFRHKVAVKEVFLDMMSKVWTDKDIEDILKAGGYIER